MTNDIRPTSVVDYTVGRGLSSTKSAWNESRSGTVILVSRSVGISHWFVISAIRHELLCGRAMTRRTYKIPEVSDNKIK
ncbi:hypothetical protein Agabi119p4_9102 [Agaricus bisporus var. burnettii]|uniref:Uncharacterized protein n=1 Tax=Agaricus bisporus var. burnettii TaxID=192524 RepID=A0A8H7C4H1_AGABI|nr:hypothetical protein Agabi119p4_9102 [Agaricus bisporus var. burnettii]